MEGISGFHFNEFRGSFNYFGEDVFENFINANNIKMIIRAYEVYSKGYLYFFNDRLVTISTYERLSKAQRRIAEMKNDSINVIGLS